MKDHFIFTVESVGALPPGTLVGMVSTLFCHKNIRKLQCSTSRHLFCAEIYTSIEYNGYLFISYMSEQLKLCVELTQVAGSHEMEDGKTTF